MSETGFTQAPTKANSVTLIAKIFTPDLALGHDASFKFFGKPFWKHWEIMPQGEDL
jgi:hypothetical protein